MIKVIFVLLLSLSVVGCHPNVRDQLISANQQTLLVRCPEVLPSEYGKSGSDWINMSKDWSSLYHECATRHNGLVDYILQSGVSSEKSD